MFPLKKPRNPSLAQIDVKPEPKVWNACAVAPFVIVVCAPAATDVAHTVPAAAAFAAAMVASDVAAMRIAMTFNGELTVLETIPDIPPAIK